MTRLLAPYLAGAAILAALWGHGYMTGRDGAKAAHAAAVARAQAETIRAAELASQREAARLAAEAEADRLAKDLEDLANDDPATDGCGLPAGRVQRLNRY